MALKRNLIWTIGALGFLAFAGLFLNYVIGRYYGPEDLGLFNIVFALYIFFSQFAVLGTHLSLLRFLSEKENQGDMKQTIICSGLILVMGAGLIISVICFSITPILSYFFKSTHFTIAWLLICPGLFFFALNKALLSIVNAFEHMRAFAMLQSLRYLLVLLALTLFIIFGLKGYTLSLIITFAEIILFIVTTIYCHLTIQPLTLKTFSAVFNNNEWVKTHLTFGLKVFPSGLIVELNSRVDILILGILLTDKEAGLYSIPLLLCEGLMQLIFVLRANINPRLTDLYFKSTKQELVSFCKKIAFLSLILVFIASIALFIGFYFLLPHLLPNADYSVTTKLLAILLIGAIIASPLQPFSMIFSQSNMPLLQTRYSLYVVGFNVFANFILIYNYGLTGAAIATSLTFAFNSILIAYLSRKYILTS